MGGLLYELNSALFDCQVKERVSDVLFMRDPEGLPSCTHAALGPCSFTRGTPADHRKSRVAEGDGGMRENEQGMPYFF